MRERGGLAALLLAVVPIGLVLARGAARDASACGPVSFGSRTAVAETACERGGEALVGPARVLFGARLDANRASAATLEVLPGIGPARAAAIVRERERRAFASVGELARVSGIGPKTVERLRPWLTARPTLESGAALADPETTPHSWDPEPPGPTDGP